MIICWLSPFCAFPKMFNKAISLRFVNSLPKDKTFDKCKVNALEDSSIKVTDESNLVLTGKNVGKGDKNGYLIFFPPFPKMFFILNSVYFIRLW